jgi:hypothetical protein
MKMRLFNAGGSSKYFEVIGGESADHRLAEGNECTDHTAELASAAVAL